MIAEEIADNAEKIAELLDQEGILPFDELLYYTNLEEADLLLALGWLNREKRVLLFPIKERHFNVMLVY